MLGYTISFSFARFVHAGPSWRRRCAHEFWTHRLCSTSGTASATRLRSGGGSLSRRAACSPVLLHGSIAVHGLRPTHRPVQSARDRQLLARPGTASLSLRHPRRAGQKHFGPSQRTTRLSHLHGYRAFDDRDGADRIAGRSRSPAAETARVRDRFHDHRPVPETVPLGTVK